MYRQVQFVTQITGRRRFQRSAETIDAARPARAYCRASSAGLAGAWSSLDHLVGAQHQAHWDLDTQGSRSRQVDDELEYGRRLDW